ncbi:glycoside hydrolase family 8 [Liquorilactobacillus nagelii]|uniref:glycoside hydrolase family 8 n=1 Tax=Liquorilactobacillus nagelii TaxID=82688 RepID=UPI00242C4016|nr:glycoside hydrolase family 8 [Liquorilactobacillus nagelii]MCI1698962.1 glycoside hydrolase family 8 [Liquorilactobacillus nagelii]
MSKFKVIKQLKILVISLFSLIILLNCPEVKAIKNSTFLKERQKAYLNSKKFIENNMLSSMGIYTNYLNKSIVSQEASGHQYLSESAGFYLLYLANSSSKNKFQSFYNTTKENFYYKGIFVYRLAANNEKKYKINATIDDLRIIKSLLVYDKIHKTNFYNNEARNLFQNLKSRVDEESYLTDYYSIRFKKRSENVTLSYQDIQLIKKFDNKLYAKSLRLLTKGFISKKVPLYQQSYNLKTEKFTTKNINMAQCLLTMEHLAEVRKLPVASQKWLQKKVELNQLYNIYSRKGKAVDRNQSASNYALAALIGRTTSNEKLYRSAIKSLIAFQVSDTSSKIYGSFGDKKTNQVYSFNELLALLALSNIKTAEFDY